MAICRLDMLRGRLMVDYNPTSLKLPCVLGGRYECLERIGSGGMGEVFRARHMGLERDVAVKLLSLGPGQIGHEERIKERFRREAVALSRLRHPNTVQVIDFGWTDDGRPYIVTELLTGNTLDVLLRREGPLESMRAVNILNQISKSLAEAHAHGIVHRDLKPSNIFIMEAFGAKDFVKLIDFGVARVGAEDGQSTARPLTVEGTTLGTPDYMAPEQARGLKPSAATDVYALGCILYEMLTGAPPFVGDSALQVMIKHIKEEPVPLGKALPGIQLVAGLEHCLTIMMKKNQEERPQSAGDVVQLLDDLSAPRGPQLLDLGSIEEAASLLPDDEPTLQGPESDSMFGDVATQTNDPQNETSGMFRVRRQSKNSRRPMNLRRGAVPGKRKRPSDGISENVRAQDPRVAPASPAPSDARTPSPAADRAAPATPAPSSAAPAQEGGSTVLGRPEHRTPTPPADGRRSAPASPAPSQANAIPQTATDDVDVDEATVIGRPVFDSAEFDVEATAIGAPAFAVEQALRARAADPQEEATAIASPAFDSEVQPAIVPRPTKNRPRAKSAKLKKRVTGHPSSSDDVDHGQATRLDVDASALEAHLAARAGKDGPLLVDKATEALTPRSSKKVWLIPAILLGLMALGAGGVAIWYYVF